MFKSLLPWKHIKTKVMVTEQNMDDELVIQKQQLVPCSTCGRTFLPQPLKKHSPICEKNAIKKRKIFDSLKQRVEGTDLAQFHQKSYLKKQDSGPKHATPDLNKSKWEENHKKLVETIRTAKGFSRNMASAAPAKKHAAPVSPQILSSNERCPFCERQFGPKAFDRHVEWCKEHKTRVQKSPANVLLAKERLEARTKYKVPPLNRSKRILVKEKYSSPSINRTESVCSVKSSPQNYFQRTPSMRKQKSVVDLGKKEEVKLEKIVVEKREREQPKKKKCAAKTKTNSTRINEIDSITVAPVKFVEFPNKKLVTWKEISANDESVASHRNVQEDEVVVVYKNSSVFKQKDNKSQFIKNIQNILENNSDEPVEEIHHNSCCTSLALILDKSDSNLNSSIRSSELTQISNDSLMTNQNLSISTRNLYSIEIENSKIELKNDQYVHEIYKKCKVYESVKKLASLSEENDFEMITNRNIENLRKIELPSENFESETRPHAEEASSSCSSADVQNIPSRDFRTENIFLANEEDYQEEIYNKIVGGSESGSNSEVPRSAAASLDYHTEADGLSNCLENLVMDEICAEKPFESEKELEVDEQLVTLSIDAEETRSVLSPKAEREDEAVKVPECENFKNFISPRLLENYSFGHSSPRDYEVPKKRRKLNATFTISSRAQSLHSLCDDHETFLPEIVANREQAERQAEVSKERSPTKLPVLESNSALKPRLSRTSLKSVKIVKEIESPFLAYLKVNDECCTPGRGAGDITSPSVKEEKRSKTSLFETAPKPVFKNKNDIDEYFSPKSKKSNKASESDEEVIDLTVKPEELFAVDDEMYEEYKIYEEMYLKEKEQKHNSKKQRFPNNFGIPTVEVSESSDPQTVNSKSNDSAYGRNKTPKLSSVRNASRSRRADSASSSSGSEKMVQSSVVSTPTVAGNASKKLSKFCHECGNKYPLTTAKFCVECGVRRLVL